MWPLLKEKNVDDLLLRRSVMRDAVKSAITAKEEGEEKCFIKTPW